MTRPESAVIIQARNLIDWPQRLPIQDRGRAILDLPLRIQKANTVVLLECAGFNELREEMWSGKRETDLTS